LRYAAFTETPEGGNPAGVVLDPRGMDPEEMLAVAREVGYSETAFLSSRTTADAGVREYDIRYFSPEAEVPFCGHATIAAAVALAERDGPGDLTFHIGAGPVPLRTSRDAADGIVATLTSVVPHIEDVTAADLAAALSALDWDPSELDSGLPSKIAYAGARHLIVAAGSRARLAELEYDFEALKALMLRLDLTTVSLVWCECDDRYHVRNPFPVGGVVEDPATGAAAAAFGAYLRELGLVTGPATIDILQGQDMGRPSRLTIDIAADRLEIAVTGHAVAIRT